MWDITLGKHASCILVARLENWCVRVGAVFTLLLSRVGADKNSWLLYNHLTWHQMQIKYFGIELQSQMLVGVSWLFDRF